MARKIWECWHQKQTSRTWISNYIPSNNVMCDYLSMSGMPTSGADVTSHYLMMTSSLWKHLPRYWQFVRGIHRSPVNSPHKGQWRGALIFFFDLRLNKRLSKQLWGWWFETLPCPLWRHSNVNQLWLCLLTHACVTLPERRKSHALKWFVKWFSQHLCC